MMTFLQTTLLAASVWMPGQSPDNAPIDYLRSVKPILSAHCYSCHGAIKQKAGLRLDTVASMKDPAQADGPRRKRGADVGVQGPRAAGAKQRPVGMAQPDRHPGAADGQGEESVSILVLVAAGSRGPGRLRALDR